MVVGILTNNSNKYPKRKQNRLHGFDYSSVGDYFITICTKNRINIFWKDDFNSDLAIAKSYTELLSPIGKIAHSVIQRTDSVYNNKIKVDKFVIMPNHIHIIYSIYEPMYSVSSIVMQLKRRICIESKNSDIWQKGFYDHVIRCDKDYNEMWDYIDANPRKYTNKIFLD